MQLIWNQEAAEKLKSSHTVLELETFEVKGAPVTLYCVVPAEKIPLADFPSLQQQIDLHAAFIQAFNNKNYPLCQDLAPELVGRFGGELDTFYEEILKRIR